MKKTDVCPWQTGNLLMLSVRRLVHNPNRIIKPYITEGMTVMDVGCGMGYFTIPMAQMIGESGHVIAADVQQEMLTGMLIHAEKAGVKKQIEPRLCERNTMNIQDLYGTVQFVILFMMLHEVPDHERLVQEVYDVLEPGGKILFAEPLIHVGRESFVQSLEVMKRVRLTVVETPHIALCRTAVLIKR